MLSMQDWLTWNNKILFQGLLPLPKHYLHTKDRIHFHALKAELRSAWDEICSLRVTL